MAHIGLADRRLPEEPDGTELQLALNDNPAARAYQEAIFQQSQPAAMFYTDVTASTIAMLNDTCGNLIQITQLAHY
jgi:hypothetical protein